MHILTYLTPESLLLLRIKSDSAFVEHSNWISVSLRIEGKQYKSFLDKLVAYYKQELICILYRDVF